MDKEQFVVRTDGGVRIGTSGMIDGKVVLHVKQGKKQDCILLERLIRQHIKTPSITSIVTFKNQQ